MRDNTWLTSGRARSAWRGAFSLIELLVVITIIVMLIALLMPALSNVRETGRDLVCQSQLRQIAMGFRTFANDHRMVLPAASRGQWEGPQPWQKSWIGKEGTVPGKYAPAEYGPLIGYLGGPGGVASLLRCPSLEAAPIGSGLGSNGSFDYAMILSFSGARIDDIPLEARYEYLTQPLGEGVMPTPMIIEEDPYYHNNRLSYEPGFGSIDRSAMNHISGGSNYAGLDGRVQLLDPDQPIMPEAWEWFAVGPRSGNEVRLNGSVTYGDWKNR